MQRLVKREYQGFSLLDMILACVVFATVVVGLNMVFQAYSRSTARGRSLLVATHLAERVMERQLALGWNVETLPRDPARTFSMQQFSNSEQQTIEYWYTVEATDLSDTANDLNIGLKEVKVEVGWGEKNAERSIKIQSLVYWDG